MNIYLVRHGTTGRIERDQEYTDELNDFGLSQAQLLGNYFKLINVRSIISSPLTRALQTAHALSDSIDVGVATDKRLEEIPLWVSPRDLHDDTSKEYKNGIRTLMNARKKVQSLFANIHNTHEYYENVVLVCHGNIIRAILCYALKMNIESVVRLYVHNASVSCLQDITEPNGSFFYQLREFNSTYHLNR